ncbi:MAG: hypothetical protein HWD61_08945 [Parachlamydiaceae bacterium]|nr:MAG: hypothetical protein HWD61_08945 [Parachlamydiaceae bacterium]
MTYKDDMLEGPCIDYFPNGKVRKKEHYSRDKKKEKRLVFLKMEKLLQEAFIHRAKKWSFSAVESG